jgi:hypothetical protein
MEVTLCSRYDKYLSKRQSVDLISYAAGLLSDFCFRQIFIAINAMSCTERADEHNLSLPRSRRVVHCDICAKTSKPWYGRRDYWKRHAVDVHFKEFQAAASVSHVEANVDHRARLSRNRLRQRDWKASKKGKHGVHTTDSQLYACVIARTSVANEVGGMDNGVSYTATHIDYAAADDIATSITQPPMTVTQLRDTQPVCVCVLPITVFSTAWCW